MKKKQKNRRVKNLQRVPDELFKRMVRRLSRGENVVDLISETVEPEPDIPEAVEERRRIVPLIEQVDLGAIFTGNGEPEVFLSQKFVRIARLIVLHTWDGTTLNYDQFGDGGGGAVTLDSPLRMSYGLKGREVDIIPGGVDATKDYMRIAFDTDVVVDTLGVSKQVYFTARFAFRKFMGGLDGLNMIGRSLRIHGPTDGETPVADFGNDFLWSFEGWGWDR